MLILITGALVVRGLLTKTGILRYPTLAALVCGGWFIPQALGLVEDQLLPDGGFALTMFYSSACLIAVYFGDRLTTQPRGFTVEIYDEKRLLIGAAILSAVGVVAYSAVFDTEASFNESGLATGIVTVYFFFSKLTFFGFGIALLLLLRRWSLPALAIVLIVSNTMLGFILFGGRRGPAVELITIVLCMLWFQKRIIVPRVALLGGVAIAAIGINSIGYYRQMVATLGRLPTFDEFFHIKFLENFMKIVDKGYYEAHNAIMYITATFYNGNYDFGLGYWNSLVFSYVPAQFVGADIKNALMLDLGDNAVDVFGYDRHIGTTFTGFADSFISFSFAGVFVFAFISSVFARWWQKASAGDLRAQALYALSLSTGLHSITHSTQWFFAFLPQLLIFILILFAWARTGHRLHGVGAIAAPRVLAVRTEVPIKR